MVIYDPILDEVRTGYSIREVVFFNPIVLIPGDEWVLHVPSDPIMGSIYKYSYVTAEGSVITHLMT